MRHAPLFALSALLAFAAAAPAAALDTPALERRVEASLLLPYRLQPPPYLPLVTAAPPRTVDERCADPTAPPFGLTGVWRFVSPVNVDVLTFVLDERGTPSMLLLDAIALPDTSESAIDVDATLRSLGIR